MESICPLPSRPFGSNSRDDHEKVHAAVRSGCAPGMGSKEDHSFRMKSFDNSVYHPLHLLPKRRVPDNFRLLDHGKVICEKSRTPYLLSNTIYRFRLRPYRVSKI